MNATSTLAVPIQENERRKIKGDMLLMGAFMPRDQLTDVYEAFLPKIGVIGKGCVAPVMLAYLSVKSAYANLRITEGIELGDQHFNIPGSALPLLSRMLEDLLPTIKDAIEALESSATTPIIIV